MPQATGSVIYNTFTKGLITDSSNLNSDPNSIKEGYNFVLTDKGTLEKRLGMKEEVSFESPATTRYIAGSGAVSYPIRDNADIVTEEATTFDGREWLIIYDKTTGILNLRDSATYESFVTLEYISYLDNFSLSVNDRFLVITSTWQKNIVYEYNGTSWESKGSIEVKVRDFEGVEDGLETDERPVDLSVEHRYNLENQGWGKNFNDIGTFRTSIDSDYKFPSNADIASLGVYENPDKNGEKTFRVSNITGTYLGNALAPRGSKILSTREEYPRTYSAYTTEYALGVGLEESLVPSGSIENISYPFGDSETNVCNTFFAGRLFYGSLNNVMFSQTLGQDSRKFGLCYQEADPTSSEISDLIETDGGMIKISGASGIFKLVEMDSNLIVFAKNGIWAISGADSSFNAKGYSVNKVSTYSALSSETIIQVPGAIIFLTTSGILSLSTDKVTLAPSVSNISRGIIQDYYDKVPSTVLAKARLLFTVKGENLYMRFNDEVLVLNTKLSAYYKLTIPPDCLGMFYRGENQVIVQQETITHLGDDVTYNSDLVTLSQDSRTSVIAQVRFIYLEGGDFKIKAFSGTDYLDNGTTPYDAYFVTTNLMFDSAMTQKKIPQLSCFFEKTETGYTENEEGGLEYLTPSACKFQIGWDMPLPTSFNLDPRNKWSREYNAYRLSRYESKSLGEVPAESLDTVMTRTSIRGRGRSAMVRFSSEAGYDCRLLGWNMDILQTTRTK